LKAETDVDVALPDIAVQITPKFVFSKFMDSFILENQIENLSDTNPTFIGAVHKFLYLLA